MPEKARLHEGILPISVMLSGWSFKEINLLILLQCIWLTASTSLLVFTITALLMRRTRGKRSVCGHYCCWQHRLFPVFFAALHLQSNCIVPLYSKQHSLLPGFQPVCIEAAIIWVWRLHYWVLSWETQGCSFDKHVLHLHEISRKNTKNIWKTGIRKNSKKVICHHPGLQRK